MISLKKQFLFVHIPKTGGNSIQNILKDYSEDEIIHTAGHHDGVDRFQLRNSRCEISKHSTLSEYRAQIDPATFAALFKFAAIRNPWDMMVSYYFSPHRGWTEWDRDKFKQILARTHTFRHYACLQSPMERLRRALRIPGKPADPMRDIDFVIRFEHLQEDFNTLCEKLDIPQADLPHRNASKRGHYSQYYDDELVQLVAKRFTEEIQLGGYRFG
jgi:hypothetical protein